MQRFKILLGLAMLALALVAGYQVASVEIENVLLKDDIQDLASQFETRTGHAAPRSNEDYRDMVVRKANEHGIDLQPGQVTVERSGSGRESTLRVSADYSVPVSVLGISFDLHFTPASGGSLFF